MTDYTITRSDADLKDRYWQGGHYAVRSEKGSIALFLFEYPETQAKVNAHDADGALAAAKAFMAHDDLVAALKCVMSWVDNWSPEFTHDPEWAYDKSKISEALKKAGA